jgi:hypothetical protein
MKIMTGMKGLSDNGLCEAVVSQFGLFWSGNVPLPGGLTGGDEMIDEVAPYFLSMLLHRPCSPLR